MNAYLLYRDSEWTNNRKYSDAQNIAQDLGLRSLFTISAKEVVWENSKLRNIASEDVFLTQTMRSVMLSPLSGEDEILYRHAMLKDAFENEKFIFELYDCVDDMLRKWDELGRKVTGKTGDKESAGKLISDIQILHLFVHTMSEIKRMFRAEIMKLSAEGFLAFYERLCEEYSDEKEEALHKILEDISFYSKETEGNLREKLDAKPRVVLGCNLVQGLKCGDFVLEEVSTKNTKFRSPNSLTEKVKGYIYSKQPGAISIRKNLNVWNQTEELERAIIRYVVSASNQFVSSLNSFFDQMHFQVGFYKAAINLKHHIERFNLPFCYPKVGSKAVLKFKDLKEVVMAIEQRIPPVGNTSDISDRMLLVITGANQGGKSTFLRSIGIAQVMMQCGLPVIAEEFESGIFPSLFTHFTRREDSAMNSGRLDEELKRMSQIIDNLGESSLVLLNESFATTTEKEGSIIAYDIIKALNEADVKVLTVTHLLSFAQRIYQESKENQDSNIEFLSAERAENGRRTFKMVPHEPELTSFGMDLFNSVIG